HRQYEHDFLNLEKSEIFDKIKRVFVSILPIISLYNPIGSFLTISLGSLKSVVSFGSSIESLKKGDYLNSFKMLFVGILASISVMNGFFKDHVGLMIITLSDIFENIYSSFFHLLQNQNQEVLDNLISALNSSVYLKLLILPSLKFLIISLFFQCLYELYKSRKDLDSCKNIEASSKIVMALIRGVQMCFFSKKFVENNKDEINDFLTQKSSSISYFFHKMAYFLAKPFWWYSEKIPRILKPINPQDIDQCQSKINEVFSRVGFVFLGIFFAPVSIVLAGLELIPRILANILNPFNYTYLKGDAENKKTEKQLSIMSMNTCFVSGGFASFFGGVSPWKNRIFDLVNSINKNMPDVVCLQEVNDFEAACELYKNLKKDYAHFYINIGSKIFSQNSGHFIASKFKISNPNFVAFNEASGSQNFVNKGLFSFELKNNDNKNIADIFVVHLSPSKDDFNPTDVEKKLRDNQLQKVLDLIKNEKENTKKILLGDFNLLWGSDEYEKSILKKDFFDSYNKDRHVVLKESSTCATDFMIDSFFSKEKHSSYIPMIVDYLLMYKNQSEKNFSVKNIKGFDVFENNLENAISDHNGLLGIFDVF
ncbi:MAG: hypothetical protein JXA94_02940, partial [Parachlamydiales bacterium]|nr:hypothetical protein [Parachlamydiales bacterium]